MGGHHEHAVPKVPDWRTYRVEDVPELVAVQKALASHGLKDPWLRNEVWKYTEYTHKYPPRSWWKNMFFRGFKYGLVAAVITAALEKTLMGDPHGHGDHGDDHH